MNAFVFDVLCSIFTIWILVAFTVIVVLVSCRRQKKKPLEVQGARIVLGSPAVRKPPTMAAKLGSLESGRDSKGSASKTARLASEKSEPKSQLRKKRRISPDVGGGSTSVRSHCVSYSSDHSQAKGLTNYEICEDLAPRSLVKFWELMTKRK